MAEPVDLLLSALETALARVLGRGVAALLCELLMFGLKEVAACVFAGSFLLLLALSNHIAVPGVARYDVLFLGAHRHSARAHRAQARNMARGGRALALPRPRHGPRAVQDRAGRSVVELPGTIAVPSRHGAAL